MNYHLHFTIKGLPRIPTNGPHSSWQKMWAERKKWKQKVLHEVLMQRPQAPLKKAKAIFTRFSSKECDDDNLRASFKAVRDGLVEAGIVEDDKPSNLPNPEYLFVRAKPGHGQISVEVREICD